MIDRCNKKTKKKSVYIFIEKKIVQKQWIIIFYNTVQRPSSMVVPVIIEKNLIIQEFLEVKKM